MLPWVQSGSPTAHGKRLDKVDLSLRDGAKAQVWNQFLNEVDEDGGHGGAVPFPMWELD
jgi:hypothetical protein